LLELIGTLLLAIPIGFYALYSMTLKALSKAPETTHPVDLECCPDVSVVIPTYNEIDSIEGRVKNFDTVAYPHGRFEVIFVDGASTDGTPERIQHLAAEGRSFIHVLRQPTRRGFNSAAYEGICDAKCGLIILGEAGTFFHPEGMISIVRHIVDPSVGVVSGKSVLYNPGESLATRLEAVYREAHDAIRLAESRIDSTPDMKGELMAFRKEIGLKLKPGETLPESAAFDTFISYFVRSLGLKSVFDPEAIFYEYAPTSLKERTRAQVRRGWAFVSPRWHFRSMILNSKFGYFGMLIAPAHFLMLIVFPWMLLVAPFILLWGSLSTPQLGLVVLALAGVALLHPRTRYLTLSFALSQIVLAVATLRLLLGRYSQVITRMPTTRK
jgi:biofilm PGA synthesis N-glycosyltransferase PgaC